MRKVQLLVSVLLLVLLLVACAPTAAPQAPVTAPQVPAPAPAAVMPATPAKPAWEAEWEKLLEAAKKDGNVVLYTSAGGRFRPVMVKALKEKYGLNLEVVSGAGGQALARLSGERRAGIFALDVYMGGLTPALAVVGEAGELLEPAFILPDVTDPGLMKKIWWGGNLGWVDKAHKLLAMIGTHNVPATINMDMVKPGEVKSYQDLLNPKWKGKIVIRDPVGVGGGSKWFAASVKFEIVTPDYMRQLAKQDPVIITDARLQVDWIAHGKYPIGLGSDLTIVQEFRDAGAAVQQAKLSERTYLSSGHSNIGLVNRASHPNAAKLFVNWILTKEGQTAVARALGSESRRLDVPTEHLQPIALRQPGMEYFDSDTEEFAATYDDYRKLAKEIFSVK